jgi:hypothetical protein
MLKLIYYYYMPYHDVSDKLGAGQTAVGQARARKSR